MHDMHPSPGFHCCERGAGLGNGVGGAVAAEEIDDRSVVEGYVTPRKIFRSRIVSNSMHVGHSQDFTMLPSLPHQCSAVALISERSHERSGMSRF